MRLLHVVPNLNAGGVTKLVFESIPPTDPVDDERALWKCHLCVLGISGNLRDFWAHLVAAANLFRCIRKHRPQIVHAHLWPAARVAVPVARLMGVPVVVHIHDMQPWVIGPDFKSRCIQSITAFMARGATHYVAVSFKVLLHHYRLLGECFARASVILNGVKAAPTPDGRSVAAPHGLRIGFAGRFSAEKAPLSVLEIFSRYFQQTHQGTLVMAGEGPLRATIEARVQALNLQDQVRLVGWQSEMEKFYSEIDVLVAPSEHEGLPLVVLEAMAAGKAVVANDVGGLGEVVVHGENGFLVRVGNLTGFEEILAQLRNRAKLVEVGRAAQETVHRRLSLQLHLAQMASLYRGILLQRSIEDAQSVGGLAQV